MTIILPHILYTKDNLTAHQTIDHFSCNCLKEVYHSDRKELYLKEVTVSWQK